MKSKHTHEIEVARKSIQEEDLKRTQALKRFAVCLRKKSSERQKKASVPSSIAAVV